MAIVVAALALPALAQGGRFSGNDNPRFNERQAERFATFLNNYFYAEDNNWWDHNDWWNDHDNDLDNAAAPVVEQEFAQEAESGGVNQSFNVSNSGDNSNQWVGVQGVANTGNAQNQISSSRTALRPTSSASRTLAPSSR